MKAFPTSKVCRQCREEKPIAEFNIKRFRLANGDMGSYPRATCKPCHNAKSMEWARNNRDRRNAACRAYRRKRLFGITREEFIEMNLSQRFCCAICGRHAPDTRRLDVDHCHRTGKLRALLCATCNVGLGSFRDSPRLLRKAAEYIETHDNGSSPLFDKWLTYNLKVSALKFEKVM